MQDLGLPLRNNPVPQFASYCPGWFFSQLWVRFDKTETLFLQTVQWKKMPSCLLVASHNLFPVKKQSLVAKWLPFPCVVTAAVTLFHTETSPFSHPLCNIPLCPLALRKHQATFLLPASFIFSATSRGLQWCVAALVCSKSSALKHHNLLTSRSVPQWNATVLNCAVQARTMNNRFLYMIQ